MSKVSLEHPRTLRTGSRLADEIKKVNRKWIGSCYKPAQTKNSMTREMGRTRTILGWIRQRDLKIE